MLNFRKSTAIVVVVALVLALAAACSAAKSKARVYVRSVSGSKLRVPASMLAGSTLTSGRSFYATSGDEMSLAGIRLGGSVREVLSRWGNPSRIDIGSTQVQAPQQLGGPQPGVPYTPPQTGIFNPNPALTMPGGPPPDVLGNLPSGGPTTLTAEEVNWTYNLEEGVTLEFITVDGVVRQITVGGQGPWKLSKIRSGLQLGDSYKLVVWVCGYPETQSIVGRFLRLSYLKKNRTLLTLENKKLVGITIALDPDAVTKPNITAGSSSVPKHILTGSSLTSGRSFRTPRLPEDALAGVRLGRPAKEVLARWGNPSRITVGTSRSEGAPNEPSAPQGIPYTPPQTGTFGSMSQGVNDAARMLGRVNAPMPGGPGEMPGLPGYGAPGTTPPELGGPEGGAPTIITSEEVTWTYDLDNAITLEFIITDGLVTQITVGGQGPWGLSKTRTGLQLGDTYKLVLWVCGYPESQKFAGRFLRLSYVNKSRALYTVLNKKLVGITIAMVPSELL